MRDRDGIELQFDNLYVVNSGAAVWHTEPDEPPAYSCVMVYKLGDTEVRVCDVDDRHIDVLVDGVRYPVWHEDDSEGGGWHTEIDGEPHGTWNEASDLLHEMFSIPLN